MDIKQIIEERLEDDLNGVESLLDSAKSCYVEGDYFQCYVRLQALGVDFDETLGKVFEEFSK